MLKVNAPYNIAVTRKYFLFLLFFLAFGWGIALAAEADPTVAERNAAQGFNDTIDRLAPDFVTVSLVVCDPDETLYSTLGHAALHLQCPAYDLDYIFTYESENVRNKIWTFLQGNLKMGMYAYPADLFLKIYAIKGRGVREYALNLSPVQEQKLWEVMDRRVAHGTNLPYDYFRRGCAKSIVDVMHEAIGQDAIHYAPWSEKYTEHTLRELGCMYVKDFPWQEFVSYFLIGADADKQCPCEKKLIVPEDLVEVWQEAALDNGEPVLAEESRVLLDAVRENNAPWCTPLLVSILLLLLSIGSLAALRTTRQTIRIAGIAVDCLVLTITTAFGLLTTYLVAFSHLPCTDWNWLIIPFNLLPALCWYWRRYWAMPWAVVLFGWCAAMAGEILFGHVLVDWPHILLALSLGVILIKQYKYSCK